LTRSIVLNLGSNIITKMLCPFFLWKQFKKEMKKNRTTNIFCFIFTIISFDFSSKRFAFGSTKLLGITQFANFHLRSQNGTIMNCKAFPRRQCSQLRFKTHPIIIGNKTLITTSTTTQVLQKGVFVVPHFATYNTMQWLSKM
jgi:hypothetical protein